MYKTVKTRGYQKERVLMLDLIKNQQQKSLLIQNQTLTFLPRVFEIKFITRLIFEKH